jgi:hypothetical protein
VGRARPSWGSTRSPRAVTLFPFTAVFQGVLRGRLRVVLGVIQLLILPRPPLLFQQGKMLHFVGNLRHHLCEFVQLGLQVIVVIHVVFGGGDAFFLAFQ